MDSKLKQKNVVVEGKTYVVHEFGKDFELLVSSGMSRDQARETLEGIEARRVGKVFTAFNPPPHAGYSGLTDQEVIAENGEIVGFIRTEDPSLTEQSHKKDADINHIVENLNRGLPATITNQQELFGDFTSAQTFQESMNIVTHAQEQFEALPAELRKRFANDPRQFLEFVSDEKNIDEVEKLGLLNPEAVKRRGAEKDAADLKRAQDLLAASPGGDRPGKTPKGSGHAGKASGGPGGAPADES